MILTQYVWGCALCNGREHKEYRVERILNKQEQSDVNVGTRVMRETNCTCMCV